MMSIETLEIKLEYYNLFAHLQKKYNIQLNQSELEEIEKLCPIRNLIHTPHTDDFMQAVPLEAAFQIDHWGTSHDDGKTSLDFFWLIGFLAQKVVVSLDKTDSEKAKHHCISVAAVMLNWYRRIAGDENCFRPGISEPTEIKFLDK